MAIEDAVERMSPRRRARLIRFLELTTDNPLVGENLRALAEMHLRNIKSYLEWRHSEEGV